MLERHAPVAVLPHHLLVRAPCRRVGKGRTAASAGSARIRSKMIAAVSLAKIYGLGPVDRALATTAELGRFADEDLAQLMRHQATARPGRVRRFDEKHSLEPGTAAWAEVG